MAGWLLAAGAVAEIVIAGMAMVDRARHLPPLTIQVPPISLATDNSQPPLPFHQTPSFNDSFAAPAASAAPATPVPAASPMAAQMTTPAPPAPAPATPAPVAMAATPAPAPVMASLPKPTPVDETQVIMPQNRTDGLVAEALALRQRGDTSTAVTRLREALAISPKNPQVIAELAKTYEKMDLQDKALEQWRSIYDMGEAAGIYYETADAKLKVAQLAQGAQASPAAADNTAPGEMEGFQQGSLLALVNLSTDEKPETSEGYKRFTLKIPVKRRPDVRIDVTGVVIQVFFYDQLGDGTVVRTNALVNDHWNNLPADWIQDDVEILDVDYTQAPPEPGKIEEGRHYYGYVVCVYYNKQLQDNAADPPELLKRYPPPLVLPDSK